MANNEVSTNMALMAFLNSKETSPFSQTIKNMMEDLLLLQAVLKEKGKQHKASCKSKLVNSVSQPLQILHMDLFGPTFIKSIMGKMYCLVINDDYSRYVVPTGRVIVAIGRYVVPAGSDNESDDTSVHNKAINTQQQPNIQPQIVTTISNKNAKFPYLMKDEYEVWAMKMEYWITNNDMNIQKRESKARTTLIQSIPNDHVANFHYMDDARDIWNAVKARESKARTTLLQSIPDDHVANFHYMDDARDIWNAVKARFDEGLHKGYDRMQKILSQLNQLKAKPEDEDINLKFLRALPSSWSQPICRPSHSAFVSATSASKKMSYGDSPNYSSTSTYSVPSNSKTGSHRSGNLIEE
nr:ribonuclease H-like domain-containing protein [Tanacetum cinerariifolium]